MEERKDLIQWIKEHKKQLIIAGISVGTLILIILGIKNQAEIKAVKNSLEEAVKLPTVKAAEEAARAAEKISTVPPLEIVTTAAINSDPVAVSRHIRNLPEGWHASPEKIAEAVKHNIILNDGQTWVDSYVKGGAAA